MKGKVYAVFLLLFVVIPYGCSLEKTTLYKIEMPELERDMTIELPMEFDSIYSWILSSDKDGDEYYKHRVSKHDLVFMEKGWPWDEPVKKYQVTVSYKNPEVANDVRFEGNEEIISQILQSKKLEFPNAELQDLGQLTIDRRKILYYMYSMGSEGQDELGGELNAWLKIDDTFVTVEFSCKNEDCNQFGQKMLQYLRTLRFE